MAERTTLKTLAAHTGFSITTVSRALAGYSDVSAVTREKIMVAASQLGYYPDLTARQLQKQRTNTVSLILPSSADLQFSNPFFSAFLSGVLQLLADNHFELNVSLCDPEDEQESYLRHFRSRRAEGFIIVRTRRQDSRIDFLKAHNIPFVAFGRVEESNDFPLIDADGTAGIRQIVQHLVSLGHQRLGCITEPLGNTIAYHRWQGFVEGLAEHNLPYDPDLVIETSYQQQNGRISALELLNAPNPPSAIVACSDLLAVGAIAAAQELGLKVGRDVSITGFDDIMLAEYTHPPLTTVHQPAHQLGTMVADMLLKIINGESVEQEQIIVQPALVVRESTGLFNP